MVPHKTPYMLSHSPKENMQSLTLFILRWCSFLWVTLSLWYLLSYILKYQVQFSSVAQLCPTLCNPMGYSMPGYPVHHQLPKLAQTHVHQVDDAIQPSYPLSSPSPPTFNLSQHQGLFQWVSFSHQVAKVLKLQLQHQTFQWISGLIFFRIDWLDFFAVQGTLKSCLQHHSFKSINSLALSFLYRPILTSIHEYLEKP